jgi:hypothetical protein
MLQARDCFQQGKMWTLLEWMLACRGRLATDPRDLVFAGLSLVDPKSLMIDSSLLMQDSRPPTTGSRPIFTHSMYYPQQIPPRGIKADDRSFSTRKFASSIESHSLVPNGLWSALKADYTVDNAEVCVNSAACFLTQSGTRELLSIAACTSRSNAYAFEGCISAGDHEVLEDLPSWVPVPGSWTVCCS